MYIRGVEALFARFLPKRTVVVRQVVLHQVIEVLPISHLLTAAAAAEPRSLAIENLAQFHPETAFERVADGFPFLKALPADEQMGMRGNDFNAM